MLAAGSRQNIWIRARSLRSVQNSEASIVKASRKLYEGWLEMFAASAKWELQEL